MPKYVFIFNRLRKNILRQFIIANSLDFRKTHELPLLLKICIAKDPSFNRLTEDCEYLNTHYIETRYPVHWPTHFSKEEAEKSLQSTLMIGSFIKNKLEIDN